MSGRFGFYRTDWLSGGLHLFVLMVAAQIRTAAIWPYALAAMSAISLFAWMGNYRRYRRIYDLPTSKIASAAQGYVELFGRSDSIPDSPVVAPLSGIECCWYRYSVEQRILEAQAAGDLSNLPGAGAPLEFDDDPLVPEAVRAACRVLKNAGYVPPEVEVMRQMRETEARFAEEADTASRKRLVCISIRRTTARSRRSSHGAIRRWDRTHAEWPRLRP
jgi:hypothetical protein